MKYILFYFGVFVWAGCAIKTPHKTQSLETLLFAVTKNEKTASILAKDVRDYSLQLKHNYGLTDFANLNNFFINIGLKKRGLCWQLSVDLLQYLKAKHYQVDYYIAVANRGEYFGEHNVLVLTCKGCGFEKGVLLDPWRYGGKLFFSKIGEDDRFVWEQRGKRR